MTHKRGGTKAGPGNGRVTDVFYASLFARPYLYAKRGGADGTLAEMRGVSRGVDADAR